MLEQMGDMGSLIDPAIILQLNRLFMIATFIVSLLIVFPSFVSLKADVLIEWNWLLVFIPAFIVDVILVILVLKFRIPGTEDNDDDSSEHTRTDSSPDSPSSKAKKQTRIFKSVLLSYLFFFTLFQVLVALNLDGITNLQGLHWRWGQVFFPFYILEIYHFLMATFFIVSILRLGKNEFIINSIGEATQTHSPFTLVEIAKEMFSGYLSWMIRVCQMVLVILKLDGVVTSTWAIIFIPFYLSGIYNFIALLLEYKQINRLRKTSIDPMSIGTGGIIFKLISFSIGCVLFYVGLGLLVGRLDSMTNFPSTAVIFIPLFIVLSILFCCVCCCAPCIVSQGQNAFEEQLMQSDVRMTQIVPLNHRLA